LLAEASSAFHEARFGSPQERETAAGLLTANPGPTSLLLLLALRREAPEAYAAPRSSARAETLAVALRERAVLNDFGFLDEDGSSFDREAAEHCSNSAPTQSWRCGRCWTTFNPALSPGPRSRPSPTYSGCAVPTSPTTISPESSVAGLNSTPIR
jgi:hypothetical protein